MYYVIVNDLNVICSQHWVQVWVWAHLVAKWEYIWAEWNDSPRNLSYSEVDRFISLTFRSHARFPVLTFTDRTLSRRRHADRLKQMLAEAVTSSEQSRDKTDQSISAFSSTNIVRNVTIRNRLSFRRHCPGENWRKTRRRSPWGVRAAEGVR